MKAVLFFTFSLITFSSFTQDNRVETCDCSVLGISYEGAESYRFGTEITKYNDLGIAKGADFLFKVRNSETVFSGRCTRSFRDSLFLTMDLSEGKLQEGWMMDSLNTPLWHMKVNKPLVGYIHEWNEREQLFVNTTFDSTQINFHDYNRDSTRVKTYTFFRKDYYHGKNLKYNNCEVYELGKLKARFTVLDKRYTYMATEYYENGKIKAKGRIHLKIYGTIVYRTENYEDHKYGEWSYFDKSGKETIKTHEVSYVQPSVGN